LHFLEAKGEKLTVDPGTGEGREGGACEKEEGRLESEGIEEGREGGRKEEGGKGREGHSFGLFKPSTHRAGSNCGSGPPCVPPSFCF